MPVRMEGGRECTIVRVCGMACVLFGDDVVAGLVSMVMMIAVL